MTVLNQIALGAGVLSLCAFVHIIVLVWLVGWLPPLDTWLMRLPDRPRRGILMGCVFAVVVFAHTVQIWVWAVALVILGAIPGLADAIYFVLVTYTTLGYGDITLEPGVRVFAAMASVTGLLTFGLSTAFLVSTIARLLPRNTL